MNKYRNSLRSERMIKAAFLELLKQKDYDEISVIEIMERADINRGTFYSHYKNKGDLLEQILNELIDKVLLVLKESDYLSILTELQIVLERLSGSLTEYVEMMRILILEQRAEKFQEKIKRTLVQHMEADITSGDQRSDSTEMIPTQTILNTEIIQLFDRMLLYRDHVHGDENKNKYSESLEYNLN